MQEWAPRVAKAARIGTGDTVLDVACGTGVLTREAARRAGTTGAGTGLDPSQAVVAGAGRPRRRHNRGRRRPRSEPGDARGRCATESDIAVEAGQRQPSSLSRSVFRRG